MLRKPCVLAGLLLTGLVRQPFIHVRRVSSALPNVVSLLSRIYPSIFLLSPRALHKSFHCPASFLLSSLITFLLMVAEIYFWYKYEHYSVCYRSHKVIWSFYSILGFRRLVLNLSCKYFWDHSIYTSYENGIKSKGSNFKHCSKLWNQSIWKLYQ